MDTDKDVWADVREQVEDYHDTRKCNLIAKRILTDADALLVVKEPALELLSAWEMRMNESMIAPTPEEGIVLRNLRLALAALPEHLKNT